MSHDDARFGSDATIACIQMRPELGRKEANVARSVALLERAAEGGASLAVLPELCSTGYMFETRVEAFAAAEPLPDGPTVRAWEEAARRLGLHVVAGIAERDIATANVSLQPQYRYAENQPPVVTGYQASNSAAVQFREVARRLSRPLPD